MTIDGNKGWYWYLNTLPEMVQELDVPVRFNIIERQIGGDRFCAKSMRVDGSTIIGYDIRDADTLLGILFDESLKFKCIAAIDENFFPMSGIDITIVLVQGEGYTNIDEDVLDSFAKVFKK